MLKRLLKSLFWMLTGTLVTLHFFSLFCEKIMKKVEESARRNNYNFKCACNWLNVSRSENSISKWLNERNIDEVAIYGMGNLGKHLIKELEETGIFIKYVIDRNVKKDVGVYSCYSNTEKLPNVQAIIVTPVYEFEAIAQSLDVEHTTEIISLEKIISSL